MCAKVSQRYGLPRVWPFKLDAVTAWLKSASASTDFQYVMLALVFIPGRPLLLVRKSTISADTQKHIYDLHNPPLACHQSDSWIFACLARPCQLKENAQFKAFCCITEQDHFRPFLSELSVSLQQSATACLCPVWENHTDASCEGHGTFHHACRLPRSGICLSALWTYSCLEKVVQWPLPVAGSQTGEFPSRVPLPLPVTRPLTGLHILPVSCGRLLGSPLMTCGWIFLMRPQPLCRATITGFARLKSSGGHEQMDEMVVQSPSPLMESFRCMHMGSLNLKQSALVTNSPSDKHCPYLQRDT